MSDREDEKLEAMLAGRRVDPAAPDLAERIISRARAIPQNRPVALLPWIRDLFRELYLPQPAYLVAGLLAVGLIIGLNMPLKTEVTEAAATSLDAYLGADEFLL